MKNIVKKKKTASTQSSTKTKTKKDSKKIINIICIIILCTCLVASMSAFFIIKDILDKSTLEKGTDGLTSSQSTILYDNEGVEFATLSQGSGVRENVEYIDIPQVVIDAFIAAEDSRFFEHSGFDLPRVISSGFANIKASGIVQGGSTLTMQLIDVSFFSDSPEKSTLQQMEQKVVEVFKSLEIETLQNKDEILENYLNKVNFGSSARGIQKGAEYYFDKDVSEITLSEAAYLAGVVNAPYTYNAYLENYTYAEERRDVILGLMQYHGYISETECDLAKSVDLSKQLSGATVFETQPFQSYIDAVVEEVIDVTGENPHETPMNIYTNMDRDLQILADELCNGDHGVEYPDDLFQVGFSIVSNQTGKILAHGGGREYTSSDDARINRAYGDQHQVGSTAKPLASYAFAFEHLGYSTAMSLEDGPVDNYTADGGTMYNADRKFRGDVTIKEAIGLSLNLPAYNTFMDVIAKIGADEYMSTMQSMGLLEGLSSQEGAIGGTAIGGANFISSPLELAAAYQTLANEGNYQEAYTVSAIEFTSDDTMEDYEAEIEEVQVFSAETAFLVSHLLQDAVENQSYQTLVNTLDAPFTVYGKSGTTDYQEEGLEYGIEVGAAKDKWMVGYTNKYTVACWAGYDKAIKDQNTWLDYEKLWANIEGTIVKAMLTEAVGDDYDTAIPQPSGVVSITHILGTFPLATMSDGNEEYLVTGLINKKFSELSVIEPDELEELSSFNASLVNNLVSVNFSEYPDLKKLEIAKDTKLMEAGGVSIEGNLFFDSSFLFGAVEYQWDIYINGEIVDSGSSSSNTGTTTINSKNGDKVKVCGYYGYQSSSVKSNEICKEVVSDVTDTLVVDASFENLFTLTTTFDDASNMVNSYVASYLSGVNVQIIENANYAAGQYDKANSTLLPGATLELGKTYTVSIGSKAE